MHKNTTSWVAWGITGCLGLSLLVSGCSDILGIEEWKDPLASSSSATSTGTGGDPKDASTPCTDGVQDSLGETDVDCGGETCPACQLGRNCVVDADCESKTCVSGKCAKPESFPNDGAGGNAGVSSETNCQDCAWNGGESDIDCGGDACLPCGYLKHCENDADCFSNKCADDKCQAEPGAPCKNNLDCESTQCQSGDCWTGLCCM